VIEPDLARMIGERIAELAAGREPGAPPLALIVQPHARRALAALLKMRAPTCLVLSISELPAAQPIDVLDVIGAPDPSGEFAGQPPGLPQPEIHPETTLPTESMAT